jgi:excisionase family DNA binding protein
MIQNRDLSNRMACAAGDDAPPVSPSRLAEHWGVHVNTVYRDIRKGALRAFRLPGGRFRIRWEDARRYGRPLD